MNQNISAVRVRLLTETGKQLGIFTKQEALAKASSLGVDLVEIASLAKPPVCKLIDFKKFKYQEKKRARLLKKGGKTAELKQIRLRPFISPHDFNIRVVKAKEFLKARHRLKLIVQFFGRQITHKEFGYKIIDQFRQALEEIASQEREPLFQGKRLIAYLSPKKGKQYAKDENKEGSAKKV